MIPTNLFDFAYCMVNNAADPSKSKSFEDHICDLAALAAPEAWGSRNAILNNYVHYLFKKVSRDANEGGPSCDSLVFEGQCCCMNLGLYTERFEEIFMLFSRNTAKRARQDWFLRGFFKSSAPHLQDISSLPERPRIYEDPSELVYDSRLPIRVNKDHILSDPGNVARLPKELQDPDRKLMAHRIFEGAVKEAERRAAANYTIAVPQYYQGGIQLLLPLCLTSDDPELCLTIKRCNGYYAARTCLTLEMAYNNARLITKPEASWLAPMAAAGGSVTSL